MGGNKLPGKPGSKEWQKALDEQAAEHDEDVKGSSEGQDFEIAPPKKDG